MHFYSVLKTHSKFLTVLGPHSVEIGYFSHVLLGNRNVIPTPSEQHICPRGEQGLCPHFTCPSHIYTSQDPPYLYPQVDCQEAPKLNPAVWKEISKELFEVASSHCVLAKVLLQSGSAEIVFCPFLSPC